MTVPHSVHYVKENKNTMANHTILLTVTKAIEITVEAEDIEDAKDYVLDAYENGEVDGDEQYELEVLSF